MTGGDPRRAERVAEGIRSEVAMFLRDGAKDPRLKGMVTVTGVEVTRDLRHARVYVSVLGNEAERDATFAGLRSVAHHLRGAIGRALRLRVAPEIDFRPDESLAHAARIEALLAEVRQDAVGPGEVPAAEVPAAEVPAAEASAGEARPDPG
jgi:ribosome-binding factor A